MLVNVKKSGRWAFNGIHVVYLEEGEQEMINDRAQELIDNGRAERVDEKHINELVETANELTKDVILESGPIVEKVEKGRAGWWHVKFEDVEKVIKVKGADDEEEAITLAIAKLEVQ